MNTGNVIKPLVYYKIWGNKKIRSKAERKIDFMRDGKNSTAAYKHGYIRIHVHACKWIDRFVSLYNLKKQNAPFLN